jgi:DTW domain-containing protein YfiP
MHPKEFRKTKNGTGHFTNLSLKNCEIFVGIDFTKHKEINKIIDNPNNNCFVLYPSEHSINLNEENIGSDSKNTVLFLIDSTWPCSRAMLSASTNIDALQKVSFTHTKSSAFIFKEQPKAYCLSTMESTLCVLELLNQHKIENISTSKLKHFLKPFNKMVAYQLQKNTNTHSYVEKMGEQ